MSSKSKSSASEASNNKPSSPATPRVSKLGNRVGAFKSDTDSPSPLQKSRVSVDQSPKSVTSKPASERRTPKASLTPDKVPTRVLKGSELQAQLNAVQEDLKKAKEKLVLTEKEKAKATEEAKEAKKVAEEANEKLREALVAQKRAEEDSEIERFRALEIEQTEIDTNQKKNEEWAKELESVRNQHSLDLNALLSTTEELERVKQELAMTTDTKNQALTHADDATKIAEMHAEKMEILSAELARVKALMDSKIDREANEKNELISQLNSEVAGLKLEVEKIKLYEEKLVEKEGFIEQLNVELEAENMAGSCARNLAEEWMKKAEALEVCLEEANQLKKSVSASLETVTKKFEESQSLLHNAESEIASLNKKAGLLETSISQQRGEIEEYENRLELAKGEAGEMAKKIEFFMSELEIEKEKNIQALNNEKVAGESFQKLLEEKNELVGELENLYDENEKNKEAMESLTAALHEVSTETRETKEKLLLTQSENESKESEVENLKLTLKSMTDKYEGIVSEAKDEINSLNKTVELSKHENQSLKEEWEKKEGHLMDCVKQSEEERSSMEREISRLISLLNEKEERISAVAKNLEETETEVTHLTQALGEAKNESMKSKDGLLEKENKLQSLTHENEELLKREAAYLKKIDELSKSLEESMMRKQNEENDEVSDSEKDYDVLPKVVEFSEQNGGGKEDGLKAEGSDDNRLGHEVQNGSFKFAKLNGNEEDKRDDSVEVDSKMWASCKIEENEFSTEKSIGQESFRDEVDSKIDTGESYMNGLSSSETQENGETSPVEQQSLKKKKPLLKKFGSLLKKKGSNSPK